MGNWEGYLLAFIAVAGWSSCGAYEGFLWGDVAQEARRHGCWHWHTWRK